MSVDQLVGQTLGQYTLLDILGSGGMGAVYRAHQASLDRDVAVKVLPADLADQLGYLGRFEREARISASLEHAHIVPVYDYGVQDKQSYVVMRLLTGGTLGEWLRDAEAGQRPPPRLDQIAQILRPLADALDYAHQRGVIHRDVKPGNIMFDDVGSVYLVDFGIARLARQSDGQTTNTDAFPALGTPAFMSPEQWRSETLTPAADQYSLAVVAYVLLCGKLPFDADTLYQMMHKHLNDAPTPIQDFRDDLPASISAALERALSKDPAQRFPSATAFAEALAAATESGGAAAIPALTPISPQILEDTTPHYRLVEQRMLPRSALLLGALAGLIAVAAVALILLQPPSAIHGLAGIAANALPTRTAVSASTASSIVLQPAITASADDPPVTFTSTAAPSHPAIEPTSVTSIAMTLTALRSNAPTHAPRVTDSATQIVLTPLPTASNPAVIGPVEGPSPLPGSVAPSSTMPTADALPSGSLRADLMGQVFRLNTDGVPFLYAFEPPDFAGQEPYLTIHVDNYPVRYHPSASAMPIGYLTSGHSYPIVQTANGYAFVRGSKFSGWTVIDAKVMTIHGTLPEG